MFGYIQADNNELKVKEVRTYRAYYCGLCRVLQKRYGFLTKLLLNYDCTFCSVVLSCVSDDDVRFVRRSCPFFPFRREYMAEPCYVTEFCAGLNIIFAYHSLCDKWIDEHSLFARVLMLLYRRAYKKASKLYPRAAKAARKGTERLQMLERQGCRDTDALCEASSEILTGALDDFPFRDDVTAHITKKLLGDMSKWVYITDAWDDRKKDLEKGCFNPVNINNSSEESIRNLMYTMLSQAMDAFYLLDTGKEREAAIAENIIGCGCAGVTERVLSGTFGRKKRRKNESI